VRAESAGSAAVALRYPGWLVVAQLEGGGTVGLSVHAGDPTWTVVLHTESTAFAADPQPPTVEKADGQLTVSFSRPGALVLGAVPRVGNDE